MDKRIKKAYDIIRKDYRSKLLLETIAVRVGLSKFHLQRLFKSEFNESPAQCLLRTRLERAGHFLKLKTTIPLSSVANDCGFSSASVFSRAFAKKYGVTPSEMLTQKDSLESFKPSKRIIEVIHLPETKLVYETTSMLNPALHREFDNAYEKSKSLNLKSSFRRIGVMNHIAIHDSKRKLNYHAGIEVTGKIPSIYVEEILVIPSSKYATFVADTPHDLLMNDLIDFKYNWLDKSKYIIRDLFILEEFLSPQGIGKPVRRIFVPIKLR